MSSHIRFTDLVIDDIYSVLAAYDPERGGALLAAGGLIHHLVEDVDAEYTPASWLISAQLTERVQAAEISGRGRLAGTVHTHPASVPDPSGPDLEATAKLLAENGHIDQAVVCVVTRGEPRRLDLPIGTTHRMSVHVARRAPRGEVWVSRAEATSVPIGRDLGFAGFGASTENEAPSYGLSWQGNERLAMPLEYQDQSLLLMISRDYPNSGPVLVNAENEGTLVLCDGQSWDVSRPSHQQLARLLKRGLRQRPQGFADRIEGLAGNLAAKRVIVAGAGSVGSWMVEELVRAGVGNLQVIDPDYVDATNLSRSKYDSEHIGLAKVDATAELCARINPSINVTGHQSSIGDLEHELPDLCSKADLIVGATDDPADQALLSHHAYAVGTPLVACALYRRAAAGEIAIIVPGLHTACWVCATGSRGATADRIKDYGTGRLAGELALGPSIHLVAEAAAGVALGLLAGPESPAGEAVRELLVSRRTLGVISTTPNWDFFPQVFDGLEGHQWAPQSIWARVQADTGCPICGANRSGPSAGLGREVSRVMRSQRTELALEGDQENSRCYPTR